MVSMRKKNGSWEVRYKLKMMMENGKIVQEVLKPEQVQKNFY